MKTLFKLLVLVIIMLILVFSENSTVKKSREFFLEKGIIVYDKGIELFSNSNNETISRIGETL